MDPIKQWLIRLQRLDVRSVLDLCALRRHLESALLLLLFFPKINLISIGGETAGLRIDDLLLFSLIALASLQAAISNDYKVGRLLFVILCVSVIQIFLLPIQKYFGYSPSVLYTIRIVEYSAFLLIDGSRHRRLCARNIAFWFIAGNAVLMTMQLFQLAPVFSSFGMRESSDRPAGITNGPWEIAAILCLLISYLIAVRPRWWLSLVLLALYMIVLSQSRSAIVYLGVLALYLLWLNRSKIILIVGGGILLLWVISMVGVSFSQESRIAKAFDDDNFASLEIVYELSQRTPEGGLPDEKAIRQYIPVGDLSWFTRITKWSIAIKESLQHWWVTLICGVGPGNWGVALDGGVIRVATEYGIILSIGLLIYAFGVARKSRFHLLLLLAFLINGIMIDIHMAYKFMSFLFALLVLSQKSDLTSLNRVRAGGVN